MKTKYGNDKARRWGIETTQHPDRLIIITHPAGERVSRSEAVAHITRLGLTPELVIPLKA